MSPLITSQRLKGVKSITMTSSVICENKRWCVFSIINKWPHVMMQYGVYTVCRMIDSLLILGKKKKNSITCVYLLHVLPSSESR